MKYFIFLFIVLFTLNSEATILTKETQFKDVAEDLQIQKIVEVLQGRVSFLDTSEGIGDGRKAQNLDIQFQRISDSGSVNVEFSVTHTLNRIPKGFAVINIDAGGVVYDSGTIWTSTTIFLKCSVANADITFFIF